MPPTCGSVSRSSLRIELALGPPDLLVPPERLALALETQPGLERGPAERVAHHPDAVPRDVERVVPQRRWKMSELDPPLRPPPHELDLVRLQMFRPDDGGRPVVFLH